MSDELAYYRARLDELTGQVIRGDSVVSRAKRELGQRRRALGILSELQRAVRVDTPEGEIVRRAMGATSAALKMDRCVFLAAEGETLRAVHTLGYPKAEDPALAGASLRLAPLAGSQLVTAASPDNEATRQLRAALNIPFFVAVPVRAGERYVGLLVAGRLREQKPFYPALDEGDLATWEATAGFLGAALLNADLFRKTRDLATSFARFVPAPFLELLGKPSVLDVGIGDQRAMEMTVLFSDIRGFTSMSEKLSPEETFAFVNAYLAHAAPVIAAHGGFIDKYIGDAIMALFPGAGKECGAVSAVRAGIALRGAVDAFNAGSGMPAIAVGVGIHTGPVILGVTGFQTRLDCTVIADAVNLASRLESLTKTYGSALLVSGETWGRMAAGERPEGRLVDRVMVKGKTTAVELWDVIEAGSAASRERKRGNARAFGMAWDAYIKGDFVAAGRGFGEVTGADPSDAAAKLLLGRARRLADEPPGAGWDGVTPLDAK